MRPSDTTRRDGYVPPCIPTRARKAPSGPGWVHEIKHDGYRLQVRRDGETVRLFTRRGYDWSGRYPAIAVTATLLRARSFTLDGEAVVCGPDGVAIFDALHRRGTVTEAMLYAFDLLELEGQDLRALPLVDRKKRLARLLRGRRLGIVLSDHTDEDGATIFRQACIMGLEGIVSKRLSAPYRSGPSRDWLKVKNPDSPAMVRAKRCGDASRAQLRKLMTIDGGEAAIRTVIAAVLAQQGEASGRGLDALFAMRQAETIVKALEHAGYEIRRRS